MIDLINTTECWYKGNLHTHTTLSDGRLSPAEVIRLYRDGGYDFISLTDHWIQSEIPDDCATDTENDGILVLRGCEWDTGSMAERTVIHIVGVCMDRAVELQRSTDIPAQALIDAIRDAGGLPILAHPAWSMTNPSVLASLSGLAGGEIYNTVSGLPWNCRPDSSVFFDLWASHGHLVRCIAADDCHFYSGDEMRSFVMVNAHDKTKRSIKEALDAGNFFASQGPLFHAIQTDGEQVYITCDRVDAAVFYTDTLFCRDRTTTGGITSASYTIKPTDTYFRVELIDAQGKRAWSSPYSVKSLTPGRPL